MQWPYSRAITTTNDGEDVTKQEPLYNVGGKANQYNHYRKQYGNSSKN
jgi:hypothetical protein